MAQANSPLTKSIASNEDTAYSRFSPKYAQHMVSLRPNWHFVNGLPRESIPKLGNEDTAPH
jgi:hypothetical protein